MTASGSGDAVMLTDSLSPVAADLSSPRLQINETDGAVFVLLSLTFSCYIVLIPEDSTLHSHLRGKLKCKTKIIEPLSFVTLAYSLCVYYVGHSVLSNILIEESFHNLDIFLSSAVGTLSFSYFVVSRAMRALHLYSSPFTDEKPLSYSIYRWCQVQDGHLLCSSLFRCPLIET
jgi:hypothetical protein